jgi:RHS repeat-associated protein
MTPNARGLPERWNDGSIVRDAYVWDKNGNLTGLTDTRSAVLQTRTRSMAYDARDRITSMTTAYNARTFSYTYDLLDNLRTTSASAGGRNLRHAYAADGRLTRLFDPANPSLDVIAYSYDDRGNATSRTSATGFIPNTTLIVPDTANRVQSMTTGGSLETFTYDGHGRRTRSTTTSGTLVHFYSQAGQLLLSENPATPTTLDKSRQYHVYLGDRRVAQQQIGSRSYIHTDHIGSLLARTDTAGSLLEGAPIWEAWGAPVSGYSSVGGLRFAGHYTDRATGLSYMQQRYYDPYAGRFLAVDPDGTRPTNFNRYWYANANPYRYVDPDGRYGRGAGWSNSDWNRFNRAQKDMAAKLERAAAKINKALESGEGGSVSRAFERTFGEGTATAENMSAVASALSDMASALNDNGSAGFTVTLASGSEISNLVGRDARSALATAEVNGKAMYVNRDHPQFGNGRELGRATGHESAHNFGFRDQQFNGTTAYIDGFPKQQNAFKNLPPEQRLINPDHLMDFR